MKQYITLLLCFFSVIGFSQNKKVHLVHGLGGTEFSWEQFSAELESECDGLETTTYENISTAGIDVYSYGNGNPSNGLVNQLQSGGANENDIAIGHSFGGVILRYLDSQNVNLFGGYITVGAVHKGAPLSNAAIDGSLENWIFQGCSSASRAAEALLDLIPFITPSSTLSSDSPDFVCNQTYDQLLNEADVFIGNGTTIGELTENGRAANLPRASIPGIGIVCTVEGHPLWTLLDDSNFNPLPIAPTFNLTADIIEFTAKSTSKTLSSLAVLSSFSPLGWVFKRKLRKASKECNDLFHWMKGTEASWNELIGAGGGITWTDYETETWECGCYNINTGEPVPCNTLGSSDEITILDVDPFSTCSDNPDCWETTIVSIPNYGPDLPSDGVLPLHRQSLPGSIHEELITNVSHFAQPSDAGIKSALKINLHPETAIVPIFEIPNCL